MNRLMSVVIFLFLVVNQGVQLADGFQTDANCETPDQEVNDVNGNIYANPGDKLDYWVVCVATTTLATGELIECHAGWLDQNPVITYQNVEPTGARVWMVHQSRNVDDPMPPNYSFAVDIYTNGQQAWFDGTCGVFQKAVAQGGGS